MNALTLILAAACIFAIAYRFYGLYLAQKVMNLREDRVTPAEVINDGHDYVKTNKYVLFGHHFAAIAAAGPLLARSSPRSSATCRARSGSWSAA